MLKKKYYYYCFVFIFILSIFINLKTSFYRTLWVDEAISIHIVNLPVNKLLITTANDMHPPLFYLILKIFSFLKNKELTYRIISIIFSAMSLYLCFLISRKFLNETTAILSIGFICLLNIFIYYSAEIRMYSQLSFFILLSVFFLLKYINSRTTKDLIFYLLALTLSFYTHYIAIFYIFSFLFFYILFIQEKKVKFLFSHFLIFFLYLPWIGFFLNKTIETFSGKEKALDYLSKISVMDIPKLFLSFFHFNLGINFFSNLVICLFFLLFILNIKKIIKNKNVLLIISLTFIPLFILILLSLKHNIFIIRTLLPASYCFIILFAYLISEIKIKPVKVFIIIFCIIIFAVKTNDYFFKKIGLFPFKAAVYPINKILEKNKHLPIIVEKAELYLILKYYLPEENFYIIKKSYLPEIVEQNLGFKYINSKLNFNKYIKVEKINRVPVVSLVKK